ncbi:MAG: DegT/DnrJ/EryC1/StrS family aminotransferase [Jatrophihabitantaceae bacterium]
MIPITRLALGDAEAEASAAVVRSGWLMNGPRTEEFERKVADYVGAKHAIAVSSATTGLHLGLLGAGVKAGDEVICPSYSFIATANAMRYIGAIPVFVDIDPRTYNIDLAALEAAITDKTTAIMPVSQIGLPADLLPIVELAAKHGLKVIEDAAPSLGASIQGKRLGSISDFTIFSFDARKILTTGEGGMVTTDDTEAATRIRMLRAHAASVSTADRDRANKIILETYPEVGFNYKMTDIQGAIGSIQMDKIDQIIAERRRLAARYAELLDGEDRVELPYEPEGFQHVYQSYSIRLHTDRSQVEVMHSMMELGVATRRIFDIHKQEAFADLGEVPSLPVTERAAAEAILLPMFVGLTDSEQDDVVAALAKSL